MENPAHQLLCKLSHRKGDEWVEHSYAPLYKITTTDSGTKRIVAGIPGSDPMPFQRLGLLLEPPYFLLYILHTPRHGEKAGRYQSPALSAQEFGDFMIRFGDYLSGDARFDLWAHSMADNATIVWDRHNQLFAYGPLDKLAAELRALGFYEGEVSIPSPHSHHYHHEFDDQAAAVLAAFEWQWSLLRPEDEQ